MKGAYLEANGYLRYHAKPHRGRYVHQVAMEKKLKRKLRRGEQVDHRDGRRTNNRPGNLSLKKNASAHGKLTQRRVKKCKKVGGLWKCPF